MDATLEAFDQVLDARLAGSEPAPVNQPAAAVAPPGADPKSADVPFSAASAGAAGVPPDAVPVGGAYREEVHAWEMCFECNVPTVQSRNEAERVCPECKSLFECPLESDLASLGEDQRRARAPRLTMVGAGRGKFQRELDKSAFIPTNESRVIEVYDELCNYNQQYAKVEGRAFFSKRILDVVANTYVREVIPLGGVIRSQHKRAALGFLVFVTCVSSGEACSRQEAALLMQLPTGLARGESLIRTIGACSELLEGLDRDQDVAWVSSGMARLGLRYRPHALSECGFPTGEQPVVFLESDRDLIAILHEATVKLLKHGIRKRVGISCIPQTRATSALYAVLKRAILAGRIPAHWKMPGSAAAQPRGKKAGAKVRGSLEWVSELCGIRPQTVKGYLSNLHKFHRIFVPIYREFELDAGRYEHL